MPLLIDGYNVLFCMGWVAPHKAAPGVLELGRRRLLGFLAASLPPQQRSKTIVVFDAAEAPSDLPRKFHYEGIQVLFSAQREEADLLIEQLIAQEGTPKALQVITSDRRLREAAQRRGATAMESVAWMEQLAQQRLQKPLLPPPPEKPESVPPEEVQMYLDIFAKGDPEQLRELWRPPQEETAEVKDDVPELPHDPQAQASNPYYPFPPDYFDDLEEL